MDAQPAVEAGCRRPSPPAGGSLGRASQEAGLLLRERGLLAPVWAYRIHAVSQIRGGVLELGGISIAAPALSALSGRITSVAVAACTVGPMLEARVAALFAGRKRLLAMALDQAGSERLFGLSDQVLARIVRDAGCRELRAGMPENPGDSGVALEEQAKLIALSGIQAQAITANPEGMLWPVKSLCFLVPLGIDLPECSGAPRCVRCASRERCSLRR